MAAKRKLDPVTLEVIRNALPATSNEMSHVLQRTSYNMMIYEVRDYCCGILDTEGNLLSQNAGGVSHFIADLGVVVKDGINKYGITGFKPGDVIITNHQKVAGQHLNNVMVYTPFFFDGELFAFPTVRAHWIDIGGASTGFGGGTAALDPWMEGLQLDQIKLFEGGELDEKVWGLLRDNIRYPDESLGDLRSQLAACRLAERRLEELLRRYGRDVVKEAIKQIFTEAETRCRSIVQELTDGVYEDELLFDGHPLDENEPTLIKVKVIVKGSDMTIDLTGCSPQRRAPFNARTLAGARVAYKAITTPLEPVNEGDFRALNILIQEGNFMMAKYPAPMGSWSRAIPSVVDTILRALAPAIPDKIPAGHLGVVGSGAVVFFGTEPDTGKGFVTQSVEGGGWGGRPWEDGESASVSVCQGDVRNAPIEKMELRWPVLVVSRALRQDSGGPGKFRGGQGTATQVKNLVDGYWNVRTNTGRRKYPPMGIWEGKSGAASVGLLRLPGESEFKTVDISRHGVPKNTEAVIATAGGGGWGDPMDRDPEKVRWDALEEYISLEAARDEYGVVLKPDTLEIDREDTAILRGKLRQQREKTA
ncbi:hydantoinase B/oxoprolinase family protein [Chloroflexota bacterium]